jgi:hypothetical protein
VCVCACVRACVRVCVVWHTYLDNFVQEAFIASVRGGGRGQASRRGVGRESVVMLAGGSVIDLTESP